jgi:hypothetical protein
MIIMREDLQNKNFLQAVTDGDDSGANNPQVQV